MTNLIGRQFGGYEIIAEIGHGGMANVYRAVQPSINREVAIKVLPAHFMQDRTFLDRFKREGQVIAQLQHPRILPVHDFGEIDGIPYIVMTLITGGTLTDALREYGPFPLENTANVVTQIAEGLDFAHKRGIIHRDFKPSNVLLDQEGNTYLADFGIAKVAEATGQLTGGGLLGTPAYMAPELASRGGTTHLVDVYALGVSVYQMLSGELPYEADTPLGVLLAHTSYPIPDVRVHRPDLPKGVHRVIERAMAKDPADRTPSAGALAQELQATVAAYKPKKQRAEKPKPEPKPAPTPPAIVEMPTFDELTPPPEKEPSVARQAPSAPARPFRFPIWAMGALVILLLIAAGVFVLPPMFSANSGSETPQATNDASDAPTPGETQAAGATDVPVGASAAPTDLPLGFAPVSANADWEPVVQTLDNGVRMVMVPAGCFDMGSTDADDKATPVHQVCFNEPFWIDVLEVSVGQFAALGGQAAQPGCGGSTNQDQPEGCISWYEAQAFCELRGARLPTEAEWEYAARGPDALTYAWGNEYIAANAVYANNRISTERKVEAVGSKPEGASWVGALDMNGNTSEWVADWYDPEYYATLPGGVVNPAGPAVTGVKSVRGDSVTGEGFPLATRQYQLPGFTGGFRCVSGISPESPVPTPTAVPEDILAARFALAEEGVTTNAEWTRHIVEFDGIAMALVPAGCFNMGSDDDFANEVPMHQVCFDTPYWIDLLEGAPDRSGWQGAFDYCTGRGLRLPTEAEFEYASRGPDSLEFSWGNDYRRDNPNEVIDVSGPSWAGVYNLNWGAWEWVNDWFNIGYFSTLGDGVINPTGAESGTEKVRKGGPSFLGDQLPDRSARRAPLSPTDTSVSSSGRCARDYDGPR